jgi:hypothetical protein
MTDLKELNTAIASMMKDKSQREALAAMLIEYIQPNHIAVDFVSMLLSTRALNPGDSLVKKLRKGLMVRTLVPGTIHLAGEITTTERVNYRLDGADIKVTASEWDFENGEVGTVASIRSEMMAKMRDYYQNKVFTALSTVWNAANTPNNFISVGGPITATVLKNAIDEITRLTGGVKAVVGIRALMNPITEFGAFWSDPTTGATGVSDPAIEEIRNVGKLGKFYGAPLVALQQEYDNPEDYNVLLPTDKILVLGNDVGEFITFGAEKWKEYTDPRPTPPQWFLELYQQFALMVWRAEGIYVIGDLTS